MSSNLEKLMARGAQIAGGDVLLRHKVVGRFRDDDFYVTEDGLAELEVDEVEVKEVKAPTKSTKKKVEEAPAAVETDVTIDV